MICAASSAAGCALLLRLDPAQRFCWRDKHCRWNQHGSEGRQRCGVHDDGVPARWKGERAYTGKSEKPLKGAKPVRDKDGKIVGWKIRNPKDPGKDIPKSLEWGRQNGLYPEDFSQKMVEGGDNVGGATVGAILIGGTVLICAVAEPCGAISVVTLGLGGTTMLATQ